MAMSFLEPASVVHKHTPSEDRNADIGFAISGRIMQQLALTLGPGQRVVTWETAVIAHDHSIAFEDAGHPALLMAASLGLEPAKLVLCPGGPVGAFDLGCLAGRVLLPQDSFLAAGPGVRLRPYSHVRALVAPRRPNGLMLMLAEGDGWVFSGGQGEVSEVALEAGETLTVRGSAIAALSATVVIGDVVHAGADVSGQNTMALLRGPGRVWLQSCGDAPELAPAAPGARRLAPAPHQPAGLLQ